MSMTKDVPEIRFMGFSESWLHKTIDDLINEEVIYPPKDGNHGGIHPKATDYVEYGIPFIMANNVRGGEIHYGGCYHISLQQAQTLQKGFAKTGDVLLTHKGTVGEVAIIGRIEFPYLMLTPQVTYYRICDTSKLDTYFLATAFRSNSFQKPLKEEAGGGTRAYIGITAQKGLELSIPQNIEEQKELGNYFQKLDTLINQHQQKHDKLSNLKKAMLEKMFPKAGENVPEIRFEGFSGEWEERSWRDTVDISTKMVDPRDSQYGELFHVGPGNIESFTGKLYDNILKVRESNLISGKFHFNKGDIIYGKINPQLAKYVIAPFEGLASADAYVLSAKNGVVQSYLFTIIHSEDFYKYSVSVSSRTGMPKINRDELNIFRYMAPNEQEQNQIGNYFQKLDALISQHSQQITKLKNIKQACLDKMFV